MSINIKGATGKTSSQSTLNKAGKNNKSSNASTQQAPPSQTDSVDLTDTATELQKIEQSLAALPIADQARIQAIGESIEQGEYKIDEEKIAERIIKSEQSLKSK